MIEIKLAETPIECVKKMCMYYRQPMYKEDVDPDTGEIKTGAPIIIVAEALRWVEKNIKKFEKFYHAVISNFLPTSTVPFPTIRDLQNIYDKYKSPVETETESEKWRRGNGIRQIGNIVHDIMETQKKFETATIDDIIKDNKEMSADQLIKKYGKEKCCAAWLEIGKNMTDEEFSILTHREIVKNKNSNPEWFHD